MTNCSLFCPTPSLAAMIINHFKMRSNVEAFNLGEAAAGWRQAVQVLGAHAAACAMPLLLPSLERHVDHSTISHRSRCSAASTCAGGMGCSAGILAVDLAQKLLRVSRAAVPAGVPCLCSLACLPRASAAAYGCDAQAGQHAHL